MSKTVNQIRTELALLAQAHAMINDFKWKDLVQAMNEDVCQYPLMTAGYVTGDNFANQDQIQLKVSICDKIYKDWNQINDDVESDTKEICRHIYNAMSSPRWKKIGRIEGFTIQKFVADFQDYTLGHTMTINFRIRKNSGTCDLPIFGYDFDSAVSGNTCEPVTYTIKDSADNVLYSGSAPSGGDINETITDSTAVLKDTDGNVLSTTPILAEGSEDIEAPNSTYEVEYENGTPIESGSIPSGGFQLIQVPNPITCADATAELYFDGDLIDTMQIPAGDTDAFNIDCSTPLNAVRVTSTTLSHQHTGTFVYVGDVNGKPNYEKSDDDDRIIYYNGTRWILEKLGGGAHTHEAAIGNEDYPWLADWADAYLSMVQATIATYCVNGGDALNILVNGNIEGDVNNSYPVDIQLTDGTNPVTPDAVTVVGNTVTIEQGEVWWKRNPNWLPLPTVNVGDNRFVGLYAVFEDDADGNTITIDVDGAGRIIDYGDGTVITSIVGTNTHTYNYASIVSPILQMEDGTNYKMVVVDIDLTSCRFVFCTQNSLTRLNSPTGWLDIVAAGSSLETLRVSENPSQTNRRFSFFLERVLVLEMSPINTANQSSQIALNLNRLRVLEYPNLNTRTDVLSSSFSRSGDIRDSQGQPISINNTVFTGNFSLTFDNTGITKLGDIILPNTTLTNQTFFNSKIEEVGDIDLSSVNSLLFFFENSTLQKVGTITVGTNLTNISRVIRFVHNLRRLVFAGDMSSVTNTTNAFERAWGLQELILPNLRVGFDIRWSAVSGQELQDLFTSLGTASGSQTITLPTFTIGDPTTIATTKGYTIAYA